MAFERKEGWRVVFFDSFTQQRLRVMSFQNEEKIIEMAKRGGALIDSASNQAIEKGISDGKGGAFLKLTPEQYEAEVIEITHPSFSA
jgi:hypothetical protein